VIVGVCSSAQQAPWRCCTSGKGFSDGGIDQLLGGRSAGDVDEGPFDRRDAPRPAFLDIIIRQRPVMDDKCVVSMVRGGGQRDVDVSGIRIREVMDGEGRVVRYHCSTTAPDGPAGEDIIGGAGPARESEDATVDPDPVPVIDVVLLCLVGVPELFGLCRREVASLAEGKLVQGTSQILPWARHSATLA